MSCVLIRQKIVYVMPTVRHHFRQFNERLVQLTYGLLSPSTIRRRCNSLSGLAVEVRKAVQFVPVPPELLGLLTQRKEELGKVLGIRGSHPSLDINETRISSSDRCTACRSVEMLSARTLCAIVLTKQDQKAL